MMSHPDTPVPLDAWITVDALAAHESEKVRTIRTAIYSGGFRHTRSGRSVRVRICDWREYRATQVVEAGAYKVDPIVSQRALRAAKTRADNRAAKVQAERGAVGGAR